MCVKRADIVGGRAKVDDDLAVKVKRVGDPPRNLIVVWVLRNPDARNSDHIGPAQAVRTNCPSPEQVKNLFLHPCAFYDEDSNPMTVEQLAVEFHVRVSVADDLPDARIAERINAVPCPAR